VLAQVSCLLKIFICSISFYNVDCSWLNCIFPKFDFEILTHNMTVFRDMAFKEVIKVNWGSKGDWCHCKKKRHQAGCQWLMPIILTTQEAEIRRIVVRRETLSRKTLYKNMAGGVAQGEGPAFKPQYLKIKQNRPCLDDSLLNTHHLQWCSTCNFLVKSIIFFNEGINLERSRAGATCHNKRVN
jgi:hypothetical protein